MYDKKQSIAPQEINKKPVEEVGEVENQINTCEEFIITCW